MREYTQTSKPRLNFLKATQGKKVPKIAPDFSFFEGAVKRYLIDTINK